MTNTGSTYSRGGSAAPPGIGFLCLLACFRAAVGDEFGYRIDVGILLPPFAGRLAKSPYGGAGRDYAELAVDDPGRHRVAGLHQHGCAHLRRNDNPTGLVDLQTHALH